MAEHSSWQSVFDISRATSVATVTLLPCDHISGTRNGYSEWHIKWIKVGPSLAETTARMSIAVVYEGRIRIVVCSRTWIKKLTPSVGYQALNGKLHNKSLLQYLVTWQKDKSIKLILIVGYRKCCKFLLILLFSQ